MLYLPSTQSTTFCIAICLLQALLTSSLMMLEQRDYCSSQLHLYEGNVSLSIGGERCVSSPVNSTENNYCRYSQLPNGYNVDNFPGPWCYGPNKQPMYCELRNCFGTWTGDRPDGNERFTYPSQGTATLKYGASVRLDHLETQSSVAVVAYYSVPRYIRCEVNRLDRDTLLPYGTRLSSVVMKLYLDIFEYNSRYRRNSLMYHGYIGCELDKTVLSIEDPLILRGIRTYLSWNCKPPYEIFTECAEQTETNESCWQYFLFKGKSTHYDNFQPQQENLIFKLVHHHSAEGILRFFYGDERSRSSGAKYFRCRGHVKNIYGGGLRGSAEIPTPFPLRNLSPLPDDEFTQSTGYTHHYFHRVDQLDLKAVHVSQGVTKNITSLSQPYDVYTSDQVKFEFTLTPSYTGQSLAAGIIDSMNRTYGCVPPGEVYGTLRDWKASVHATTSTFPAGSAMVCYQYIINQLNITMSLPWMNIHSLNQGLTYRGFLRHLPNDMITHTYTSYSIRVNQASSWGSWQEWGHCNYPSCRRVRERLCVTGRSSPAGGPADGMKCGTNKKAMISTQMKSCTVTDQCVNKWRTLEENVKLFIDIQQPDGRHTNRTVRGGNSSHLLMRVGAGSTGSLGCQLDPSPDHADIKYLRLQKSALCEGEADSIMPCPSENISQWFDITSANETQQIPSLLPTFHFHGFRLHNMMTTNNSSRHLLKLELPSHEKSGSSAGVYRCQVFVGQTWHTFSAYLQLEVYEDFSLELYAVHNRVILAPLPGDNIPHQLWATTNITRQPHLAFEVKLSGHTLSLLSQDIQVEVGCQRVSHSRLKKHFFAKEQRAASSFNQARWVSVFHFLLPSDELVSGDVGYVKVTFRNEMNEVKWMKEFAVRWIIQNTPSTHDIQAFYTAASCKPVDGRWSSFVCDECSVTCGLGTYTCARICTNPSPSNGGAECIGDEEVIKSCYVHLCDAGDEEKDTNVPTEPGTARVKREYDCAEDSDCISGWLCAAGTCVQTCLDADLDAPCASGVVTSYCTEEIDCEYMEKCLLGICHKLCLDNTACTSNQYCYAEVCMERLSDGQACSNPQQTATASLCKFNCANRGLCVYGTCVYGVCEETCTPQQPCKASMSCLEGRCITECSTRADSDVESVCGKDGICQSGQCFYGTCNKEQSEHCRVSASSDQVPTCHPGSFYMANGEKGLVCQNGIYAEKVHTVVVRESGCGPNQINRPNGACGIPCNLTKPCSSNDLRCISNVCEMVVGSRCQTDLECGHAAYCESNKCAKVIKPNNLCFQESACGVHEKCIQSRCKCITGGDGQCIASPPTRCMNDQDCPPTFVCSQEHAWCTCPQGKSIIGNKCITSLAECSAPGDCVYGWCYSHTCYPSCPCPAYMVCYREWCTLACASTSECDSDQFCSFGACIPICTTSSDCHQTDPELLCKHGLCTTTCTSNRDCLVTGWTCFAGKCVIGCTSDDDCPSHQTCSSKSVCSARCSSDESRCERGEGCQQGSCLPMCDGDSLGEDSFCFLGYVQRRCEPGQNQLCGSWCSSNYDCAGRKCAENICTSTCNTDSDCEHESINMMCLNGGCVFSCTTDSQCNKNQFCNGTTCSSYEFLNCDSTSDCAPYHQCQSSDCRFVNRVKSFCDRRISSSICGVNERCSANQCISLKDYTGRPLGLPPLCPATGKCTDLIANSQCNVFHNWCECKPGQSRVGNRCLNAELEVCFSDDQCPVVRSATGQFLGFSQCLGVYCFLPCAETSPCQPPFVCSNGYCLPSCLTSEQCIEGQRCVCGVCMVTCPKHSPSCYDGIERVRCLGDTSCLVAGQTCILGNCLPNCTGSCDFVSTKTSQCDCNVKARDYMCMSYEVRCPPSSYQPDGFVNRPIDTAKSCHQLIPGSHCSTESKLCECDEHRVRYGGGKCLPDIQACDGSSPCPGATDICENYYCLSECNDAMHCVTGMTCYQGYCRFYCSSRIDCLAGQTCENNVCLPVINMTVVKPVPCLSNATCQDPFAVCDTKSGLCECGLGTALSNMSGLCEWILAKSCISCTRCETTCAGDYMVCNRDHGVCVCDHGYQMDSSYKYCSVPDGVVTGMHCTDISDCNQLPNSMCNQHVGRCECRIGYCFVNRQCVAEEDKCQAHSCPPDSVCQYSRCLPSAMEEQKEPLCVSKFLGRLSWTVNRSCVRDLDCKQFGANARCYGGTCICKQNYVMNNEMCVEGVYCYKDEQCPEGPPCVCPDSQRHTAGDFFTSPLFYILIVGGCLLFIAVCVSAVLYQRSQLIKKKNKSEMALQHPEHDVEEPDVQKAASAVESDRKSEKSVKSSPPHKHKVRHSLKSQSEASDRASQMSMDTQQETAIDAGKQASNPDGFIEGQGEVLVSPAEKSPILAEQSSPSSKKKVKQVKKT